MNKLRLAIIGAGGISNSHVRAYKQMEDVEIVAGADIIPSRRRAGGIGNTADLNGGKTG